MSKYLLQIVCLLAVCASPLFAGVTVSSPANGSYLRRICSLFSLRDEFVRQRRCLPWESTRRQAY